MAASVAKYLPFPGPGPIRASKLWSPVLTQLGRCPWTTALSVTAGSTRDASRQLKFQYRTNSTLVNRPAVYDSPPPLAPAVSQPTSTPAQLFQPPEGLLEEQQESGNDYDGENDTKRHIFLDAVKATRPRNDWTRTEVASIYYQPLLELTHQAVSGCHGNRPWALSLSLDSREILSWPSLIVHACKGNRPSPVPRTRRGPTMHAHEHQRRRLHRRLLLLRTVYSASKGYWPDCETGRVRRVRPLSCAHSQGER